MSASKRPRQEDEDLDRALALSLAEPPEQEARAWADAEERVAKANREALDHAIASSLEEEEAKGRAFFGVQSNGRGPRCLKEGRRQARASLSVCFFLFLSFFWWSSLSMIQKL